MKKYENMRILNRLAAMDRDYQQMKRDYLKLEKQFNAYVDAQSFEIRNMLCGYTQLGMMMSNRKTMIACEYMRPNVRAKMKLIYTFFKNKRMQQI